MMTSIRPGVENGSGEESGSAPSARQSDTRPGLGGISVASSAADALVDEGFGRRGAKSLAVALTGDPGHQCVDSILVGVAGVADVAA